MSQQLERFATYLLEVLAYAPASVVDGHVIGGSDDEREKYAQRLVSWYERGFDADAAIAVLREQHGVKTTETTEDRLGDLGL